MNIFVTGDLGLVGSPLVGSEPLISFDKARQLIGYLPEYKIIEELEG